MSSKIASFKNKSMVSS